MTDDGGYWETRDLAVLARKLNASTAMLEGVVETMRQAGRGGEIEFEAAVERCRNRLRVRGGNGGPPAS